MNSSIRELISRRQRQVLLHSFLYYELDVNYLKDSEYDALARELAQLIREYPEEFLASVFPKAFKGYTGATGMGLPYHQQGIYRMARSLFPNQFEAWGKSHWKDY